MSDEADRTSAGRLFQSRGPAVANDRSPTVTHRDRRVATSSCADTSTNGDRVFSVAAPRAWNRLPTELKLLRSTDLFRRDLKTFRFHFVYGHQDTD